LQAWLQRYFWSVKVLGVVREHDHPGPVYYVPQARNGGLRQLTKTLFRTAVARLSPLPYNDRCTKQDVLPPRSAKRLQNMAGDERSS
jgi:hypothetical protein